MTTSYQFTRQLFDGATTISKTETVSADGQITLDESIPGPSTNLQLTFSFTKTKLQSIYIVADGAITILTNSSGAPQETIVLIANQPIQWTANDAALIPNPFAGNVTTIFVTSALSVAANLKIRCQYATH